MSQSIRNLIRELSSGVPETARVTRPSRLGRRRRNQKTSKRTLKRWTWDATDNGIPLIDVMKDNMDKIFLGVSDFDDLITSKILQRRVEAGQKTYHRETTVLANKKIWSDWAEQEFDGDLLVEGSGTSGFIICEETNEYITYSTNSNSTSVRAFGSEGFVADVMDLVETNFSVVTSYIEWIYGSDGHSVNVPLNRERLPLKEMYPFLGEESLEDYYDRYMDSNANILLLIGPPGTGKTTFIRGLLAHRECSAIVTYDAGILEKDGFFARFIEDDAEVMVLEDSDAFLKSRSDGNTMMHRFLNVGDGLVTTKGKKMIFSTNLPSIRDIDSALVRPGRCFDIVTFGELSRDDAQMLADKLHVPLLGDKDKYSLAEIFNQQSIQTREAKANRKLGFI